MKNTNEIWPISGKDLINGVRGWLALGLVIRLSLAPFTSHPYDMAVWISHMDRFFSATLNPLNHWKFSLPLMALLLITHLPAMLTTLLMQVPFVLSHQFWIKTPFILCDMGVAVLLGLYVTRASKNLRMGRLAVAFWILNPVAIFFTAVHGQLDALPSFLLLGTVVMLQENRSAPAHAMALGAGIAKFAGFFVVPLVWLHASRRINTSTMYKLAAVSAGVTTTAFLTLLVPGLSTHLFSGISSSSVAVEKFSLWSIWSLDLLRVIPAGIIWFPLFLSSYAALVGYLWFSRSNPIRKPSAFLGCTAAILAVLIALDPGGNPQFILWVMPLLAAMAFERRSGLLLLSLVAVALCGLSAILLSESSITWFYNAVPTLRQSGFGTWSWPVNVQVARVLGSLYGVGLMVLAACALHPLVAKERKASYRRRSWSASVLATTTLGGLICLLFLASTFQPELVERYGSAPDNPPDLTRLNTWSASEQHWLSRQRLVARFEESDVDLLSGRLDRAYVTVTTRDPLEGYPTRRTATSAVPITPKGLQGKLLLSESPKELRLLLLLGNRGNPSAARPKLPKISVFEGWREVQNSVDIRLSLYRESNPGWYLVRVTTLQPIRSKRLTIDLRSDRDAGWVWNGGARSSRSAQGFVGGKPSRKSFWIAALATPASTSAQRDALGELRLISDGRLQLLVRPTDSSNLKEIHVLIPEEMQSLGPFEVALSADLTSNPWWRSHPSQAIGMALLSALLLVLFVRWGFRLVAWAWHPQD